MTLLCYTCILAAMTAPVIALAVLTVFLQPRKEGGPMCGNCGCCYQVGKDLGGIVAKLDHQHKMLHHQHAMLHAIAAALADLAGKLMTPEETKALIAKLNAVKTSIDTIATPPAP